MKIEITSDFKPSKIVCVGRNYAEHAAELGNAVPTEPLAAPLPVPDVVPPLSGEAESDDDELPDSVGLADAMPGLAATAAPTPNATARAPTRPM